MKEFRTELVPRVSAFPMGLRESVFTIGSCFAAEIGNRLYENKFNVWNNRLGTVYNPVSIHRLLLFGLENKLPTSESYLWNEGINLNHHFHSFMSSLNEGELENKIKNLITEANGYLKNADRIILTYGTAFVYQLKRSGEIIANCHKIPSASFEKLLLTEAEILRSFEVIHSKLNSVNPKCKIILTVSPVRHLKDTLELNSVSKSVLRLSCHSIVNQFSDVEYFPAYEILLDDLRDYRFYKTDRLHPTDEAIEFIWGKFATAYFDEPAKRLIDEWKEIRKSLEHKPFHAESESHQRFLKSVLDKLDKLNSIMDLSDEIQNLKIRMGHQKPVTRIQNAK